MYPAAIHRIPTQTVDSSKDFERWILQKQPKIINKMTKSGDKITIKDLEQVCPKQAHDFLSWLLSSKIILPRLIMSTSLVISFGRSLSQKWISKKRIESLQKIYFQRNWQYISHYKLYNIKCFIIQLPNNFALRSAEWSVVLCLNR